jgi:hypothetical protein
LISDRRLAPPLFTPMNAGCPSRDDALSRSTVIHTRLTPAHRSCHYPLLSKSLPCGGTLRNGRVVASHPCAGSHADGTEGLSLRLCGRWPG